MDRRQVVGLALVVLGATLAVLWQIGAPGEITVAVVGAACLVVYALARVYAFLVAGGVLTGLGVGLLVETAAAVEGATVGAVVVGLVFVALLERFAGSGRRLGWWWPVPPAVVLAVLGAVQVGTGWPVVGRLWPVAIVVTGLLMLLRAQPGRRLRRRRRRAPPGGDDEATPTGQRRLREAEAETGGSSAD